MCLVGNKLLQVDGNELKLGERPLHRHFNHLLSLRVIDRDIDDATESIAIVGNGTVRHGERNSAEIGDIVEWMRSIAATLIEIGPHHHIVVAIGNLHIGIAVVKSGDISAKRVFGDTLRQSTSHIVMRINADGIVHEARKGLGNRGQIRTIVDAVLPHRQIGRER